MNLLSPFVTAAPKRFNKFHEPPYYLHNYMCYSNYADNRKMDYLDNSEAINSACFSTVSVASNSMSGG